MSKQVTPTGVAPIKTSYAAPAAPIPYVPYVKPEYPHKALPILTDMDVPSTTLLQTLFRAVRVRRAGASMAEAKFVSWLANRLPITMIDEAGNIHVDTRKTDKHRTMFTAHTDTVHHVGGPNEVRLDVQAHRTYWRAGEGACLGADDGAGVALMMHMLEAQVPGYYVFFRGEESGGTGSRWLADNMAHTLTDLDRCVSFDRADYADVITHQGGGRCCSDAFAAALADALTDFDRNLMYLPCNGGVFTDSANLTHIIPECTNLSVGYKHQHGDGEWQDITHLTAMAAQIVAFDWDTLPTARNPKVKEYKEFGYRAYRGYNVPADTDPLDITDPYAFNPMHVDPYPTYSRAPLMVDEEAQCAIDALYEAASGYTAEIVKVVSAWLMPDAPHEVSHMLRPHKLTPSDYAEYAQGIEDGSYDYTAVLDLLGDDLQ